MKSAVVNKTVDDKKESYKLEHELYLSEFKIILATLITTMFGLVIGVATENIKTVLFSKIVTVYGILYTGLIFIYFIRKYYHNKLSVIREEMLGGK